MILCYSTVPESYGAESKGVAQGCGLFTKH